MKKRKINGYLKLLLVLLFSMALSIFSTCYASGPAYTPINEMTPEIAQEIFDYYKNNNSFNYTNNATQNTYNNFYSQINSEKLQSFCDVWNSKDFSNCADYIEQCIFMIYGYNNKCYLKVFFNNNGIGNSFNHFKMDIQAYKFVCYYRDDNNSNITGPADHWIFNDTGVLSYSWRENISTSGTTLNYNQETSNFTTYDFDNQLFESKVICAYHLNESIFLKPRTKSEYYWYLLNGNSILDFIPIPTPTPEPTPSIPITGTITNNSGEKTGSIDLSGITSGIADVKNQISGDTQKVINNQNENTDKIIQNQNQNTQVTVNAINNANENYWGGEEDLNEEKHNQEIEGNINDLMENVSGELAKNEVVKMLDEAEKGFIAKFQKGLAEEAYDLKFEWTDIKYEGLTLIEAGELNISKICRENETMGVVKGYIQVIATFTAVMNILATIYNMILHSMGLESPTLTLKFEEPIQNDKMLGPGPDDNGTIHL